MRRQLSVQREKLTTAIASASAEIRRLSRQRHRDALTVHRQSRLSSEICFILFVWTAPSSALALAYVAMRTRAGEDCTHIDEESLQARYLQTPLEKLAEIMTERSDVAGREFRAALKFRQEYNMYLWIKQQNESKGVAPTIKSLQEHAQLADAGRLDEASPTATEHSSRSAMAAKSDKMTKRMQRFRMRWGLRKGTFAAGERLTKEETRRKVASRVSSSPAQPRGPKRNIGPEPPGKKEGAT